jgi:hypothetical protein
MLVMTALVPLAALGLDSLRRFLGERLGRPAIAAAGLCVLAGAITTTEYWIKPQTTNLGPTPQYYNAVEKAPAGTLAEYPLAKSEQAVNSDYLFWQRIHQRPLVNGAAKDTFAEAASQSVIDPLSPETPASLAALGVTVIVVRPTTYFFSGGKPGPAKLGRGYSLAGSYPDASVWRVTAPAAPAISTFTTGFSFTETPVGQPTSRWMISPEARVDLYTWEPGTYVARFQVSSYGRPRTLRVIGRNERRAFGVLAPRLVTVTVRLPAGRSSIRLSATPAPEVVPDGRSVSIYMTNWQFLPAGGASEKPLEALPG